ncbi:MAG: hypothetical protein GC160_00880 [Acidobacteria bacterium]|nr:hypothetical protein [Acidobacteriota bacterium]
MLTRFGLLLALSAASLCAAGGILEIVPIQGEHAVHDPIRGIASPTVIEVHDAAGKPARGVEVTFSAPAIGPSGRFADGSRSQLVTTGSDGRASMVGFQPNSFEGPFSLAVSAHAQDARGSIVLRHSNRPMSTTPPMASSAAPRKSSGMGKKLLIILGVGAAITAASVAATGGSPAAAPSAVSPSGGPITITVGDIRVGPPQ